MRKAFDISYANIWGDKLIDYLGCDAKQVSLSYGKTISHANRLLCNCLIFSKGTELVLIAFKKKNPLALYAEVHVSNPSDLDEEV